LNGIFAFAVWANDQLFFARDRLGVKPFFYSNLENNFIFGSEIKTLLEHSLVSRDVPWANMERVLTFSTTRPPGFVPFRDIQELEPGRAGTVRRCRAYRNLVKHGRR